MANAPYLEMCLLKPSLDASPALQDIFMLFLRGIFILTDNMHQLSIIDFIFIASGCCENDRDVASKVVDGKDGNEVTTEGELSYVP